MMIQRSESGETLLEVVMALVVIGLVVSAYFATFSTQGTGSTAQRNLVTADGLLRDYAEATKAAVRHDCGVISPSTYTTTTTSIPGFSFGSVSTPAGQDCPAVTGVPQQIDLTVTMPKGSAQVAPTRSISIDVRTP
jgi:hypothetical protein